MNSVIVLPTHGRSLFAGQKLVRSFFALILALSASVAHAQTDDVLRARLTKGPKISSDIRIVRRFAHDTPVSMMAWSDDGRLLATLSDLFRRVTVWNANSGEKLFQFRLALPFSNILAFTPDSRYLLSGSDVDASSATHTAATLWDMSTGRVAREIEGPFPERMLVDNLATHVAVSRDGKLVALIAQQDMGLPVALYETGNWTVTAKVSIPGDIPEVLAFSNDGRFLAIGTVRGKIEIFDITRQTMAKRIDAYDVDAGGVGALCYLLGDNLIAASHGLSVKSRQADGTWKDMTPSDAIRIWNVTTGGLLKSFSGRIANFYALACSPTHQAVISGSVDSTLRLWAPDTAPGSRTLLTFSLPPLAVSFGPDGQRFATIGDNLAVIAEFKH